jgi:hypothetical protein
MNIFFPDKNFSSNNPKVVFAEIKNLGPDEKIFYYEDGLCMIKNFKNYPEPCEILYVETNFPVNKKFKIKHFYLSVEIIDGKIRNINSIDYPRYLANFIIVFSHKVIFACKVDRGSDNGKNFRELVSDEVYQNLISAIPKIIYTK